MTAYEIARIWMDAIRDSIAINDFCTATFGELPTLFLGADPRDLPGKKDTPYIAILPHGSPSGGVSEEETRFGLSVFIGMKDDEIEKNDREVEYRGQRVIEKDFNPLVLNELNISGEFIPDKVSWEVGQLDSGFFLLENVITVNLPNTLGPS